MTRLFKFYVTLHTFYIVNLLKINRLINNGLFLSLLNMSSRRLLVLEFKIMLKCLVLQRWLNKCLISLVFGLFFVIEKSKNSSTMQHLTFQSVCIFVNLRKSKIEYNRILVWGNCFLGLCENMDTSLISTSFKSILRLFVLIIMF